MAYYCAEDIRKDLEYMEAGKSIAYFDRVFVIFTPNKEFKVFKNDSYVKHGTSNSVKETIKHVQMCLA